MTRKKRPWSTKAVADVKALAQNGKCVTAKVTHCDIVTLCGIVHIV